MKFSDMPYQRVTPEEVAPQFQRLTGQIAGADIPEQALNAFYEYQALSDRIGTMASLSHVRFTLNTKDAFYAAEHDFYDEAGPQFQEMQQNLYKALVNSPHRAYLENTLGRLLFLNIELDLKTFSPEIADDLAEENRLTTAYVKITSDAQIPFDGKILNLSQMAPYEQSTDRHVRREALLAKAKFFAEHETELDRIFDDLVKVRTKMARALGFSSFVELGYCRMGRNCYDARDVEGFRQNVKDKIVPLVVGLKKAQARRLGLDALTAYDEPLFFPTGNACPTGTPEEIFAHGKVMYGELSPETKEFMDFMLDRDLFDVLARPGKSGGGYCTTFDEYQSPFIFANFNGTAHDIDVLTHEAGHALAAYRARGQKIGELRNPTMESCEIHSMSMEFFTWPWMEGFFFDQTDKYKYGHLSGGLIFLPYGVIVDAFQHKVYENPELSPKERKQLWMELEREYRPWIDWSDIPFYNTGGRWQAQAHIYEMPFYYIDYCLAQTVAFAFWADSQKDFKDAWRRYFALLEKGGTQTFTQLVKSAGLPLPFAEGALDDVADAVKHWLDSAGTAFSFAEKRKQ